jgi:putative ABC transport system permease protein
MGTLWQDIRYGLRMMAKNPGFTAVAVLTLALGIGANTAIFSVVNAVLFRPLPYLNPDRLVGVWEGDVKQPAALYPASLPDFRDLKEQNRVFERVAAYAFNRFNITGKEGPDQTRAAIVTPDFFPVMGVKAVLGRTLSIEDDRDHVVVLSDSIWHRRYGASSGVLGKTIVLNDEPYTIVGVMPRSFHFPTPEIELWCSFALIYGSAGNATIGDWINNRSVHGYQIVARLKQSVSLPQAASETSAIAERLAGAYPESNSDVTVRLVPLRKQILGDVQPALLVLLAAVGFILLIACANVANLMLARTSARDREIAVRRALGANQVRLLRQVLTESTLLSAVGGGAGLLLAYWGVDALLPLIPRDVPRLESVAVDRWALCFTLAISLLTGILFGLAPSLRARKLNLNESLREGGRGSAGHLRARRVRSLLVVGEIAVAVVLLVASGLLLKSFARLADVNPGFNPDHLLTMSVDLSLIHYRQPEQQIAFWGRVLQRIRALPGVTQAGACTSQPPAVIQRVDIFQIEGRPAPPRGKQPTALYLPMTPGYLEALGVPLFRGRLFTDADSQAAPSVAIINQTIAQQFFSGQDPLEQRIQLAGVSRKIVGIVGDTKYEGLGAPADPQIYVPYAQSPFPGMYLFIRTTGDPLSVVSAAREAIQSVDPTEQPNRIKPMTELLSDSLAQPRFNTFLIGLFGGLAFILATIGVYGVINFDMAQRTNEIGIRVALGASPGNIFRLVVGQGLALALLGVLVGLAGAFAFTRYLQSLLFSVHSTDPAIYAGISALLTVVATAACLIPARRAMRVDPIVALRYE